MHLRKKLFVLSPLKPTAARLNSVVVVILWKHQSLATPTFNSDFLQIAERLNQLKKLIKTANKIILKLIFPNQVLSVYTIWCLVIVLFESISFSVGRCALSTNTNCWRETKSHHHRHHRHHHYGAVFADCSMLQLRCHCSPEMTSCCAWRALATETRLRRVGERRLRADE